MDVDMTNHDDSQAAAQVNGASDDHELEDLFKEAQAGTADGNNFWEEINNRQLDVGEKADDAVDYEDIDISDEELLEEEESGHGDADDLPHLSGTTVQEMSGDNAEDDELDELFGDNPSSPVQDRSQQENMPVKSIEAGTRECTDAMDVDAPAGAGRGGRPQTAFRAVNYGTAPAGGEEEDDPELREQMALFEAARRGAQELPIPSAPQTSKEIFDRVWPGFEPGKPPRFHSLIPRKRAFFIPRTPGKPPRSVQPTKVSLELAVDQEKSFRLPSTAPTARLGRPLDEEEGGIIQIHHGNEEEQESSDEMELDEAGTVDEHEKIGNVSWGNIKIACEDWDLTCEDTEPDSELLTPPDTAVDEYDWIRDLAKQPTKKRRLGSREDPITFSVYDNMDLPTFDDPELATARLSKKIILDMNDPHLLLDVQQPNAEPAKPRTTGLGLKRDNRGSLANPMFKRYNISNDEAYDALKESSQQKVRSTIGHQNVEHSLPALKLQYPFYKVNLNDRELRSFHRPNITFKPGERASISTLKSIKKKHKRNQKPSEAFATAEDLNIGDNSDLLLAEYSEEYPTTLSNFGMGIKILNYYRRKDNEDTSRPKAELGETSVLLPQDKSPFSLFGQVNPGEQVLTLHNAMYRAPVFKHAPQETDFVVSRSSTGIHGSKYYMRSIPNLLVVGQEFPSVEVPGTHARKVTEASKKRLKMLAFRLYRRGQQKGLKQPWVSNEMIKSHLPGTEIAQNRSRMREIMKYVKETGTWQPLEGETIPDEPSLRTWIKPEDICLIDSMHAGDKQLQDAGINAKEIKDDDEGAEGEQIEMQLAPWRTTKNFLHACAGKAMLELHGQGDPTARGEAFSFIKTSMKGGFKDIGESAADRVDAKMQKEMGGHSYNVQRQQAMYEKAIQRIWNKQKESLSSDAAHSDADMDLDAVDARPNGIRGRSEAGTPSLYRGADDDTMSQFSRNSGAESRGKKLRITRTYRNKYDELENQVVTVTDPEVIKMYLKRKRQERIMNMNIDEIKPTGDPEYDQQQLLKLRAEMKRLERNIERREGREKAKGMLNRTQSIADGMMPQNIGKGGATPRKCANCGEVGHIKTNKKLCPLLNGQKKQSDTFKDASAASPATVAATPVSATPQTAGSPL